ncbi:hypothetical protein Bca4012_050292 [Brassica carinata]
MGGIRKKELVTIGDLHTYLSNSNAQSQEADFLYKLGLSASSNRMVGLMSLAPVAARSWTNMAPHVFHPCPCPKSSLKMAKTMQTFVVFDTEMSKLTKTEAATLALEERPEAERAPGGDIHTGQAPSSATDTGGLSGKAKEVDDANLPSEKKKNQKLTP